MLLFQLLQRYTQKKNYDINFIPGISLYSLQELSCIRTKFLKVRSSDISILDICIHILGSVNIMIFNNVVQSQTFL